MLGALQASFYPFYFFLMGHINFIIDGYDIEVRYRNAPHGAKYYVCDMLPKATYLKVCEQLYAERYVFSITKSSSIKAVYRGAAFQEAHDKLEQLYRNQYLHSLINAKDKN